MQTYKTKTNKTKQIKILKVDGALQLNYEKKPILNYQFEMTYPPKGVDEKYKKSGFLHPVWSPGGEVLTRIQAPDHYHHYGIWGPWGALRSTLAGVTPGGKAATALGFILLLGVALAFREKA